MKTHRVLMPYIEIRVGFVQKPTLTIFIGFM